MWISNGGFADLYIVFAKMMIKTLLLSLLKKPEMELP